MQNEDSRMHWVQCADTAAGRQGARPTGWDSAVGSLAESQEVQGADEPMQVMLFDWKMSPTCMGFHCLAPRRAPPHKNPLQVGCHVSSAVSSPHNLSSSSSFAVVKSFFYHIPLAIHCSYQHMTCIGYCNTHNMWYCIPVSSFVLAASSNWKCILPYWGSLCHFSPSAHPSIQTYFLFFHPFIHPSI